MITKASVVKNWVYKDERNKINYELPKYTFKQLREIIAKHKTEVCNSCTVELDTRDCLGCLQAWHLSRDNYISSNNETLKDLEKTEC